MLVPKKHRQAVYSYLFKEGVIVVKKDPFLAKHQYLEVPNIQAMKLLQSLKSRAYVKEQFSWQHYYYTLTDEGIEYLRDYLHVSADTVPATLKKQTKPSTGPSFGRRDDEGRGGFRGGRGGRGGYREGGRGGKFGGAPGEFQPEFEGAGRGGRGGFRGRGRGGRGGFEASAE